jgi:formate dehydrogenase gamma subunit
VQGSIHSDVGGADNYWANLIRNFYIYLIIGVIGGMVVHNIMDFIRKIRIKWSKSKLEPSVERMTKLERILHAMMATSFILLAYTGFALMFPTEWWVAPINWLGELFGNAEVFRSQLHRFCGLILTFVALHHLWFLFFHKRGIEQRKHFMIRFKDVRDFRENIMWYLGKRKDRPRFGRFTYMEKAEYWALVWGTAVMVLTGFVLWFQEIALMFMPKWLWDVALVVHEYEAILAVLAIVVWHFYYVIINPDEAPLSQAFITGRMPLEEVAHCHAEEFEEIMKEQQAAAEADKESKNVTDA